MVNTSSNFTKEDFLNATDLVKILNEQYGKEYDLDTVKKTMESEFRKKTLIKTKHNKTQLIYDAKWNHRKALRLHPLGLDTFKEILEKGK